LTLELDTKSTDNKRWHVQCMHIYGVTTIFTILIILGPKVGSYTCLLAKYLQLSCLHLETQDIVGFTHGYSGGVVPLHAFLLCPIKLHLLHFIGHLFELPCSPAQTLSLLFTISGSESGSTSYASLTAHTGSRHEH